MKTLLILILCSLLTSNVCSQGLSKLLPVVIKSSLDRKFPGWKFLEVREEIRQFLKERVSADARPEMIKGDFDGNGRLDYALLIEHGKNLNEQGEVIDPKVHLLVFLNKRGRYKFYELLDDTGEYLTLGRKGTDGFDWHADKKFKYVNDAIEVWFFERAGWAYVYKNGKFRYVYMLD